MTMVSGDCTSYGGASAPIKLTLTHYRSYNQQLKQQHLPISSEILPSSEQIAGSEDLLSEIFLRLPPKSPLRFQCVSKHWLSLISSTYFRRLHTRRNATSSASTVGVFLCRHPNYDFLSLHEERLSTMGRTYDRLSDARDGKVLSNISSCNGLLCLGLKSDDVKTEFYVYNLTTGHHRFIPVPDGMVVKSMNLAFDPKRSGDYDVVCVWLSVSENQLRFSVYSSGSGVWRHSTEYCNGNVELCCYRGVFWKGAIHWFSQTAPFLCFQVDSCELKSMPSTQIPEGQWYRSIEYFGESGGHLHLIEIHKPQDIEFDVLELKSDYSQWFVKCRVNLEFLTSLYPAMVNQEMYPAMVNQEMYPAMVNQEMYPAMVNQEMYPAMVNQEMYPPEDYSFPYAFTVLCFLADEENNARLLISIPGKIILYEMQSGIVKELADIKPDSFRLFIGGARRE